MKYCLYWCWVISLLYLLFCCQCASCGLKAFYLLSMAIINKKKSWVLTATLNGLLRVRNALWSGCDGIKCILNNMVKQWGWHSVWPFVLMERVYQRNMYCFCHPRKNWSIKCKYFHEYLRRKKKSHLVLKIDRKINRKKNHVKIVGYVWSVMVCFKSVLFQSQDAIHFHSEIIVALITSQLH